MRSSVHNDPSAKAHMQVVAEYIQAERQLGRLVGPLPKHASTQVHVSTIGLICT